MYKFTKYINLYQTKLVKVSVIKPFVYLFVGFIIGLIVGKLLT